ncbi:MAG: RDD family protein [Clostridia bacterium]|nr:RDD family protein [Clostridia bacterium]
MIYDLQKPTVWKRLSAYLFDIVLIITLAIGFAWTISGITRFDAHTEKLQKLEAKYYEEYDIPKLEKVEDIQKLSEEELERYNKANEAFQKDPEVLKTHSFVYNSILLMTSLGVFLAVFIWEFIIPLFFKNGQTLGKKIFGIAVMRTNGVKISTLQLFVRSILGKYTFEIMLPVFAVILVIFANMALFGVVVLAAIFIAQVVVLTVNRKTRSALHDLLSDTVTVDLASQLIFDSEEELIKYKEEQHAIMAERSPY